MADLAATFRKPFAEQVAAFRLRLGDLVPAVRWDDIERSAHDRAFMVHFWALPWKVITIVHVRGKHIPSVSP